MFHTMNPEKFYRDTFCVIWSPVKYEYYNVYNCVNNSAEKQSTSWWNESCTKCTLVFDQRVMEWVGNILQDTYLGQHPPL